LRPSRLYALSLIALAVWVLTAEHKVSLLSGEMRELGPRLARVEQDYRDAVGSNARDIEALGKSSERAKAELVSELTRTNELISAYGKELHIKSAEDERRSADARAQLATLRRRVVPEADTLLERMLAPTVQLNGTDSVGSGTLVWSGRNGRSGCTETYVLTACHVVRNILGDAAGELRGLSHTIFTRTGKEEIEGDVVALSEQNDLALVKLRSARTWAPVAHLVSKAKASLVRITDQVYAAGCPLGNDPMLTRGELSALTDEVKGANYWMLTAPTYFGNSGGGVYLADTLELIGVFSKIYTAGKSSRTVVTHMGMCTPVVSVYEWLEREGFGFLLEDPAAAPQADASTPVASGSSEELRPSTR